MTETSGHIALPSNPKMNAVVFKQPESHIPVVTCLFWGNGFKQNDNSTDYYFSEVLNLKGGRTEFKPLWLGNF